MQRRFIFHIQISEPKSECKCSHRVTRCALPSVCAFMCVTLQCNWESHCRSAVFWQWLIYGPPEKEGCGTEGAKGYTLCLCMWDFLDVLVSYIQYIFVCLWTSKHFCILCRRLGHITVLPSDCFPWLFIFLPFNPSTFLFLFTFPTHVEIQMHVPGSKFTLQ